MCVFARCDVVVCCTINAHIDLPLCCGPTMARHDDSLGIMCCENAVKDMRVREVDSMYVCMLPDQAREC